MDFGILRLPSDIPTVKRYHLFDKKGKMILVADHGTPWLPDDPERHVRFALPAGDTLATMELTWTKKPGRNGRLHTAYAIILDHVVYAIINKYLNTRVENAQSYYVVEVAETLWLALSKETDDQHYSLYGQVPSDLMIYDEPQQAKLPDPIGFLYAGLSGEYDFNIAMPTHQINYPALVSLALVFLVDYGRS
ncbi:MAG: hypothetical protein DWQ04_26655 [Chloroflexi bacterium]|nr:MAG: hypothetical protein DWQ04_26655 [Chloroflexota bacterium]